jgi:putative sterol carrier protein
MSKNTQAANTESANIEVSTNIEAANIEAANIEEDPCNKNCTAHYMNQNNELEECMEIKNKELCFTSDGYEEFYSNIKWNKLAAIIEKKFEEFNALLTREYRDENSVFQRLFKNVFSIVDNKLKPPRDRLNDEDKLFIKKSISKNDDHKFCNDINYSFSILNRNNKEYRIFHIALHSKASKYEIGKQRSKYICKYFEKKITNGIVEDGDGSGPFHYKIDNPNRKDNSGLINIVDLTSGKVSPIDTMKAPFKTFDDNNNCRFDNNNEEFIIPTSFDKILTDDDYALHNYIYNKFVDFWNNNILPEVHVNSSKVIKIQKHIRGKLTRRRYKKQKSASIKIQTYVRDKLTRSKISKYSPRSKKTAKSYSPSKSKNNSIKRSATI